MGEWSSVFFLEGILELGALLLVDCLLLVCWSCLEVTSKKITRGQSILAWGNDSTASRWESRGNPCAWGPTRSVRGFVWDLV